MPYLTPGEIPADKICRVLRIPDNPAIIAAVTGAIQELVFTWNWEQGGVITPLEITDAMQVMADDFSLVPGTCKMIGEIVIFPAADPPVEGWLVCDGDSLLRDEYPDLFAVIGTLYGAADGSHFSIPDLRGRVVVGVGPGFALSGTGGEQEASLTIDTMPAHDHSIDHYFTALALAPGELPVLIPDPFSTVTGETGGGNPHNNLQPLIVLNYFIVAVE